MNCEITPVLLSLADKVELAGAIDLDLYDKYDVKKGLRDINGKGVVAGLMEISEICATTVSDGKSVSADGKLFYRGMDIEELVGGFVADNRFGFEEITYLLLFGELPNKEKLNEFNKMLAEYRTLPTGFVRDIILKAPSADMMNGLARCVLTLYSYDKAADDISIPNVLRQSLQLIALFPLLSVYSFHAYSHYYGGKSLYIHAPDPSLSTAENILRILRPDSKYTDLEARLLDIALVLHAEHGGGNNSSFTTHVVTSSGTDTYSAIAAALGSLKGPRHGGANVKVVQMVEDIKKNVDDWEDDDKLFAYLSDILNKKAFDKKGLIYGMGHAVYSLSDPRARVLRSYVKRLSREKGLTKEYNLYRAIERLAPQVIAKERKIYKGISANVDFYSGFVYSMLDLPQELYTPIFAIARISGWSAHRLEELTNRGKIIRPAYIGVSSRKPYAKMGERR